jgi:hypothetical protein
MNQFGLLALGALFLQPLLLPIRKFRKAFAADTQFNNMKGHGTANSRGNPETQLRIEASQISWQHFDVKDQGDTVHVQEKTLAYSGDGRDRGVVRDASLLPEPLYG